MNNALEEFDPHDPKTWGLSARECARARELMLLIAAFRTDDPSTWGEPPEVTDWEREGLTREDIEQDRQGVLADAAAAEAAGHLATAQMLRDVADQFAERLEAGPLPSYGRGEALAHWISKFRRNRPNTWRLPPEDLPRLLESVNALRQAKPEASSTWCGVSVPEIAYVYEEVCRRHKEAPETMASFEARASRVVADTLAKIRVEVETTADAQYAALTLELQERQIMALRTLLQMEQELFSLRARAVESIAERLPQRRPPLP